MNYQKLVIGCGLGTHKIAAAYENERIRLVTDQLLSSVGCFQYFRDVHMEESWH